MNIVTRIALPLSLLSSLMATSAFAQTNNQTLILEKKAMHQETINLGDLSKAAKATTFPQALSDLIPACNADMHGFHLDAQAMKLTHNTQVAKDLTAANAQYSAANQGIRLLLKQQTLNSIQTQLPWVVTFVKSGNALLTKAIQESGN